MIYEALAQIDRLNNIILHIDTITLPSGNDKWPDLLAIQIDTARNIDCIIPNGDRYFIAYFMFTGQKQSVAFCKAWTTMAINVPLLTVSWLS